MLAADLSDLNAGLVQFVPGGRRFGFGLYYLPLFILNDQSRTYRGEARKITIVEDGDGVDGNATAPPADDDPDDYIETTMVSRIPEMMSARSATLSHQIGTAARFMLTD